MVTDLRASVSSQTVDRNTVVVRLGGAVNVANVAAISTGILDALGSPGSDLIVDLRHVTSIDARVVRALLLVLRQAEERKHAIAVVRPAPTVWRTVQLSGLDGAFPKLEDPTEVCHALDPGAAGSGALA